MPGYNLTSEQKKLLNIIVTNLRDGTIREPLIPAWAGISSQIIGIKDRFGTNLIDNLNTLCEEGLLGSRLNSRGEQIFSVKQSGYDAVDNDFEPPFHIEGTQVNIGAIIHEMSGGNVQTVGFANQAEVRQIVNDPELLNNKVESLTNELLDVVKNELLGDELIKYVKSIEQLKEQLIIEEPDLSLLEKVLKTLSFFGDIEGTISLMARAWPYLYPLIILGAEKLI